MNSGKDNMKKKSLRYSENLIKQFQDIYYKKFSRRISEEKAALELNFLARMIETLYLDRKNKKTEARNGE